MVNMTNHWFHCLLPLQSQLQCEKGHPSGFATGTQKLKHNARAIETKQPEHKGPPHTDAVDNSEPNPKGIKATQGGNTQELQPQTQIHPQTSGLDALDPQPAENPTERKKR